MGAAINFDADRSVAGAIFDSLIDAEASVPSRLKKIVVPGFNTLDAQAPTCVEKHACVEEQCEALDGGGFLNKLGSSRGIGCRPCMTNTVERN